MQVSDATKKKFEDIIVAIENNHGLVLKASMKLAMDPVPCRSFKS